VPERVSTKSFVVLIIGNSKSFHLGAQGTFKGVNAAARTRAYPTAESNEIFVGSRGRVHLTNAGGECEG